MANPSALTISFLDRQPYSAAQALTEMSTSDAAAFLDSVPLRYAVGTVSHMNSWYASGIIKKMKPANGAAILREVDYPTAASILRLMPPEDRPELLALLPAKLRRDFETSISYPDDTVGAHMTTSIISLDGAETVASAIGLLRKSDVSDPHTVFIVDDERRLVGTVPPASLLRSAPSQSLAGLADQSTTALSARARLTTVIGIAEWEIYPDLPVLSRKKQLIGALSSASVRKHQHPMAQAAPAPPTSIFGAIAGAFYESAIGLGQVIAELDPSDPGARKQDPRS